MSGSRAGGLLTVLFFAGFAVASPIVIEARQADSGGGDTRGAADDPKVVMRNLKFEPATLTIKRGTTVRFDNADVAPHTVTAASGQPDSGVIGPGKAYELMVTEPLDYVCTVHPSMKASIELSG